MNTGCLSNDDGEGIENVLSYQNECAFFNCFAFIFFNSFKMADIGELPKGVLRTAPKFGLREEIEFVPVFTPSKQRRKRNFTVVFLQVVKKSALDVQNSFFIYFLGLLPSPSPSPSSLLLEFIDMSTRLGIRTRFQ